MRDSTSSMDDAIMGPVGYKATGRLTVYKSRVFFETYTDFSPEFALPVGEVADYPLGEALSYNTDIGKIITIVNNSGQIALLVEGTYVPVVPMWDSNPSDACGSGYIVASPTCRPGIYENTFWYHDLLSWKRVIFDPDLVDAGDPNCIISITNYADLPLGAISPISETEAVIFYYDEGGVRFAFISDDDDVSNSNIHSHQGRLFNPTHVYDYADTDDAMSFHYSGAVEVDNSVFAYYTHYDGSVKVSKYEKAADGQNGIWSDFFIAVPSDISTFEIGNVFKVGSRIFICGRFYRKEEFVSGTKYTLLLWSDDGITFSVDRKTLVSNIDLRFLAVTENNNIVFSSTNRYHVELSPYQIIGESATSVNIVIDTISGNTNSGWSVKAKGSDVQYIDNDYIDTGAYAKLEIGVHTTEGVEYIKYHDVIVSGINMNFEDAIRTYQINLVADALWHTSMMTHPFYMEVQGKQSVLDTVQVLDNLYKVETPQGINWTLSCDFWTKEVFENGGLIYQTHVGGAQNDHWCPDIKEFCTDYPIFDDSATFEIRLYGWSRAGIPSGAPGKNPTDTTPTSTNNDDFYALMLVEDEDGIQTTYVSTIAELDSTYSHPEQTWFTENVRSGSYPVVYNMTNPGEGKKLIKVGMRVISPDSNTTYYVERVEMPGITVNMLPYEENASLKLENSQSGLLPFNVTLADALYTNGYQGTLPDVEGVTEWFFREISKGTIVDNGHYNLDILDFKIWKTPIDEEWELEPPARMVEVSLTLQVTNKYSKALYIQLAGPADGIWPKRNPPLYWPPVIDFDIASNDWAWGNNYVTAVLAPDESTTLELTSAGQLPKFSENFWLYFGRYFYFNETYPTQYDPSAEVDMIYTVNVRSLTTGTEGVTGNPTKKVVNTIKGVPQIYFSQRPYSAYNFDCTVRSYFTGEYSEVGIVGLAVDGNNYIAGTMESGKLTLTLVRNGIKTLLKTYTDSEIIENGIYDLRFWHRDGEFGVEYKLGSETVWPVPGSMLSYSWLENDGTISTNDDIFHVGIFSIIDPPKFRTTGFSTKQTTMGVMPLDINPETGISDLRYFAEASTPALDVGGNGSIFYGSCPEGYTAGSLTYPNPPTMPFGPYELRLKGNVYAPFNRDPLGGGTATYMLGDCLEFLLFKWLNGTTENQEYFTNTDTKTCCLSSGWSMPISVMQWKAWIKTDGEVVWERERCKAIYDSNNLPPLDTNFSGSMSDRVWITNTIPNIVPEVGNKTSGLYPAGTFVFLDNNDKITILGFTAESGDHNHSITTLLDKFCKISGTSATFPGDFTLGPTNIVPGNTVGLQ